MQTLATDRVPTRVRTPTTSPTRPGARAQGRTLAGAIAVAIVGALAGAFAAAPALAARPDPQLARAVAAIDARAAADVDLLAELVNQNSGTFNRAGVEAVAKRMAAELTALGFDARLVDNEPLARGPHVVAEHRGRRGRARLLLIGHMDTVFEPFSPFRSLTRSGERAIGPGTSDMKGGLVVMLAALRGLKAAGALDGLSITVVLTGDEENVGKPVERARAVLVDAAKASDYGLCFESGISIDGVDYASTARRGATTWHLASTGHPGHSSGVFNAQMGDGAIYELARVLSRFNAELREPNLTYSVGLALGGANVRIEPSGTGTVVGKPNIIPAEAEAIGDIRALTPAQLASVQAKMQAIVAAHLPGTSSTISFDDSYPPMAPTPGNEALRARYSAASEALGLGPVATLDPMRRGAGDSAFIAPYVDTITGLGAVGEGSHAPGESVELAKLPVQAKRAAAIILALGTQAKKGGAAR